MSLDRSRTNSGRRATRTDRLEMQLREEIITNVIAPGARLKPATLAPSYGVSATPFREVLDRLSRSGLVVHDPYIGARVSRISIEEMEDLYETRLLIEREALCRSIRSNSADWRAGVERAMQALQDASRVHPSPDKPADKESTLAWLRAHRDFHSALISACGSPWLLRLMADLYSNLDRYAAFAWTRGGLASTSEDEHLELYEKTLAGNASLATEALTHHLRSATAWYRSALGDQIVLNEETSE